ncbi:phosphatidylinositol-4-phosphate 5-Kinase [Cardiosporidium cionae]|uniref:Phosphatidylinositol-4-phosphate 5-Kinase n=1 Tax=Cardiosporidium cionae TaxID=476202 RepID=A0ABQ7JD81_9APIC|nr:phosphatidylinositol-4-phosphate 5-Kinase [Cardiosporidium cionae]|eukprot:KAF8821949.1 phosphatidylinositol-4-phosphate 5-Kinase [Cardiosporidium cionae]
MSSVSKDSLKRRNFSLGKSKLSMKGYFSGMKELTTLQGNTVNFHKLSPRSSIVMALEDPMIVVDFFKFLFSYSLDASEYSTLQGDLANPNAQESKQYAEDLILLEALRCFCFTFYNFPDISFFSSALHELSSSLESIYKRKSYINKKSMDLTNLLYLESIKNTLTNQLISPWMLYKEKKLDTLMIHRGESDLFLNNLKIKSDKMKESTDSWDKETFIAAVPGQSAANELIAFSVMTSPTPGKAKKEISRRDSFLRSNLRKQNVAKAIGGKQLESNSPFYALSFVMMIGIRLAVDSTNYISKLRDKLKCNLSPLKKIPTVFARRFTFSNVAYLNNLICSFTDYSSDLFANTRQQAQISDYEYFFSLCRTDFSFIEFASNSKSGQFFFFSHDGKYLIKTVSQKELKYILSILPRYASHLQQNPSSLLARMFGLHRVELITKRNETERGFSVVPATGVTRLKTTKSFEAEHSVLSAYFMIQGAIFDPQVGVHEIYDLKGSTVGRKAKPDDKVKKDTDWILAQRSISLDSTAHSSFLKLHEIDCLFLRSISVFDYSLLLGIHNRRRKAHGEEGIKLRSVKLLGTTLMAVTWAAKLKRAAAITASRNEKKETVEGCEDFPKTLSTNIAQNSMNSNSSPQDESLPLCTPLTKDESTNPESSPICSANGEGEAEASSGAVVEISANSQVVKKQRITGGLILPRTPNCFGASFADPSDAELYFVGVIDFITPYTPRRLFHTLWKRFKSGCYGEISPVPPVPYAKRQIRFVRSSVSRPF